MKTYYRAETIAVLERIKTECEARMDAIPEEQVDTEPDWWDLSGLVGEINMMIDVGS